jgi:serine/threonine-protein kinase HipA
MKPDRLTELAVKLVLPDGVEVSVGTLRPTNVRTTQSATFQYAPSYLSDPRAYAINPELPLVDWPGRTNGTALFRCMADSTPDRWGRALIDREANHLEHALPNKPRSTLELDCLVGVRDDTRQGALRYFDADGAQLADAIEGVPKLVDLDSLLELTDEMLLDPNLDIDIKDLVAAGSSLGGARPKASVVDDAGNLLIAKFPNANSDDWDVPAWEKLTLKLAANAGIDVPNNHLVKVLGRNVLMLERFDRTQNQRKGYISAITLASAQDGDHSFSFADLAEYLEPIASTPDVDLPQLFRRAIFGLAISNTDNHLRNHGFLRDGNGWRLAPAFDMNPNPLSSSFATSIAPRSRNVLKTALEWAELFRVSQREAKQIVEQISDSVSNWKSVATALEVPSSEIKADANCFCAAQIGDCVGRVIRIDLE